MSKELKELQAQYALGLITDHDLWLAFRYPNRVAPGEKEYTEPTITFKNNKRRIVCQLILRKYTIDPRGPNDVLHWVKEKAEMFISNCTRNFKERR